MIRAGIVTLSIVLVAAAVAAAAALIAKAADCDGFPFRTSRDGQ